MNKIIKWLEKPLNRVIVLLAPLFIFIICALLLFIDTTILRNTITFPVFLCVIVNAIWLIISYTFIFWCDKNEE